MHAKWVFVLLAIAFGLGFVIFGVGSGSTGISDALQNAFNFGGGSGTSIGSLQKKVAKHPTDAAAWLDLATAYETKQRTQDAVNALQQYVALKPKDANGLGQLASQYTTLVQNDYTALQTSQSNAVLSSPATLFQPPTTSPLSKVLSTDATKSPLDAAVQAQASTDATSASTALQTAEQEAVSTYQQLAKLTPKDPTAQLQLGNYAQLVGDNTVAIAAFETFLKLAPDDLEAPKVRTALKALKKAAATASSSSSGG